MSVSSVNSGSLPNAPALNGTVSQRAANPPAPASAAEKKHETSLAPSEQSAIIGAAAPTPHANQVGVAAYVAIMNPPAPTSMRAEA